MKRLFGILLFLLLTTSVFAGAYVGDELIFSEESSKPTSPSSGELKVYSLTDGILYFENDSADTYAWITSVSGTTPLNLTLTTNAITGTITSTNLAGTTNQVNLSASGTGVLLGSNNITLSLPQSIDTSADVTFDSITLDDLTAGRVPYSSTDGLLIDSDRFLFEEDITGWTAKDSVRSWASIAMSSDGSRQTAGAFNGQIYISTDYGATWTAKDSVRNWWDIAMSSDGSRQTAVVDNGQIYISTDYGATWTAKDSARNWWDIAMSSDGSRQTAVVGVGGVQIYINAIYGEDGTI